MGIAGLVYKDIIVNRKNMKLFGIMIIVTLLVLLFAPFRAGYDPSDMVFLGMLTPVGIFFIVGGGLQCTVFTPDENRQWAYFIGSTPNGCERYAAAKYIYTLMLTFAAGAVCLVWDNLMGVIHESFVSCTVMIYTASCVQLILRAVDIPFILRFGTKKGMRVKGILLLALVFAAIVYLLFGDISMFGSLDDFREWVFVLMTDDGGNIFVFLTVIGLLALPMFYASYRISSGLYVRGVEQIEG